MSQSGIITEIEKDLLKEGIPEFSVGDTISVHSRIIEGGKERIQVFTGVVIARKGSGLSETISLYRVSYGSGMERVFILHSPKIAKIEVVQFGRVRRSKLYYLRGAKGKAAKVRRKLFTAKENKKVGAASAPKKESSSPELQSKEPTPEVKEESSGEPAGE